MITFTFILQIKNKKQAMFALPNSFSRYTGCVHFRAFLLSLSISVILDFIFYLLGYFWGSEKSKKGFHMH